MESILIAALILGLIAWAAYKFFPAPIGLVIAVVAGVVFLIKYLIPLL